MPNIELGEIHAPNDSGLAYNCEIDYRWLDGHRYHEGHYSGARTEDETNSAFFRRIIEETLRRESTTKQIRIHPTVSRMGVNSLSLCAICGKWTSFGESLVVEQRDNSGDYTDYISIRLNICRHCINEADLTPPLQECSICGAYQQVEEDTTLYYGGWDETEQFCCSSCGKNYRVCEGCGHWTHVDSLYDGYCSECRHNDEDDEPSSTHVHDYGYKPTPLFHHYKGHQTRTEGERVYLGVELEIDNVQELPDLAEELTNMDEEHNLFYLKWDSSLDRGFEIVSHPCTLKYHKVEFPWSDIMKKCRNYGAQSHETTTCGLHIHFNVASLQWMQKRNELEEVEELNLLKLLFIVERFWTNFEKFARRKECSYAPKVSKHIYGEDGKLIKKVSTIKDMKAHAFGRTAVNLNNKHTVEFRLFKGTLNYDTFIATLELVDYIIHFIRDKGVTYIYKMSWDEFVKQIQFKAYPYLVNYLKEIKLEVKQDAK